MPLQREFLQKSEKINNLEQKLLIKRDAVRIFRAC